VIRDLSKWQLAIGTIFLVSLLGAVGVRLLGAQQNVLAVATPALVIAAWASFGHLITIDDDFRGGFSNPDGDPEIQRSSLVELSIKFIVLVAVALTVLALQFI
jgi:hypothetical protein